MENRHRFGGKRIHSNAFAIGRHYIGGLKRKCGSAMRCNKPPQIGIRNDAREPTRLIDNNNGAVPFYIAA